MKLIRIFTLGIILFFAFCIPVFSINEVTVKVPGNFYSSPGYIDKATLVVEPHGGYTEQSLYLQYSDHGKYYGNKNVEIIHRFELPQGAVVNDMWLWIGDSVMKAICLDTWTARSIYDSIVSMKRDPAFLSKKGNQYELHIYPLVSGYFRKIKINFITPTRWIDKTAAVELPLLMLKSNNNSVKPLEVLFRTRQNIWGIPGFKEIPDKSFDFLSDTSGLYFKRSYLTDISQYNSLKLTYSVDMSNGVYFDSNTGNDDISYFQSSFQLKDIFGIESDSTSKKNLIGIDLSGNNYKRYSMLIPNLKKILKASLKQNDLFNIIISGAGNTKKLSSNWINAIPANIDAVLDGFVQSKFADSVSLARLPDLVYCDYNAALCWGFTGIEGLATINKYSTLYEASNYFSKSDIVASYEQGYENIPDPSQMIKILACLDSFFVRGGRFVTYYDFNRDGSREPVASHYIQGLKTKAAYHNSMTLYRNINGNIGADFPESIEHAGTYTLDYNDPDVRIELQDKFGNAVVISKRIGNGLIVVSGIWSFNDDAPLKKLIGVPLLGLNHTKYPSQLRQTLDALSTEFVQERYDKALVISNSDSLILSGDANSWAANYALKFSGLSKPIFNSINLVDGTESVPTSVTVNNVTYYGSGYLLKKIADNMTGTHLESHLNDWDMMSSMLSPYSIPVVEQLAVEAFADNKADKILEFKEIRQEPIDNNSPRFFIGSAASSSEIKFNISAKFAGSDSFRTRTYTMPVHYDTTQKYPIIPAMLGSEIIKGNFANGGWDTTKIVKLALKYNLLCDYTSLLALEPNDTIHFMINPFDESLLTNINKETKSDSLGFSVFPNPFNSQTKILIQVKNPSRVNLYIYNILGQLVKTIAENEEIVSGGSYMWDGRDSFNHSVSSGIYFTRVELKENSSNKNQIFTRKLLLLK